MIKKAIVAISLLLALVEFAGAVAPGFYAGGGLGVSRLDTKDHPLLNDRGWSHRVDSAIDRGGLGWKAFIGYNLNEFLGLELAYNAYADSKYAGAVMVGNSRLVISRKNSLNAVSLVGKAALPLGDSGFSIYGLAGGAQVNSRMQSTGEGQINSYFFNSGWIGGSTSASQNKFRLMYGGGAGYAFSEQFSGNLELSRIQGDEDTTLKLFPNADALILSLTYHFSGATVN